MGATMMVFGPIKDPFAQRVGIENWTKKYDRSLTRIPIFKRVIRWDTSFKCLATEIILIQRGGINGGARSGSRFSWAGARRRAGRVFAWPWCFTAMNPGAPAFMGGRRLWSGRRGVGRRDELISRETISGDTGSAVQIVAARNYESRRPRAEIDTLPLSASVCLFRTLPG